MLQQTGLTFTSKGHHSKRTLKKAYTQFLHSGHRVYRDTFCYIHGIGQKRFKIIKKHFQEHGVIPREHGNARRLPHNTLSLETVEYILRFLTSMVSQHGILLPGCVPGYKRDDLKLLPSSMSP